MTRREARQQALLIVFQSIFFENDTLEEIWDRNLKAGYVVESKFGKALCQAVFENKDAIDSLIAKHLTNWKRERISNLALSSLRLAVAEFMYMENIPTKATINEAIELTKRFASQQEASFVNGVLSGVVQVLDKKAEDTVPACES